MVPASNRWHGEHRKVNFTLKCLVDVGLIVGLIVLSFVTYFFSTTRVNGYYCSDVTIRYPKQEETINSVSLYLITLGFPVILLGLGEILFASEDDYEEDVDHFVCSWQVPKSFVRTYDILVSFSFGFMVCVLIAIISQTTLGSLRPNFIDACKPEPDLCAGVGTDNHTYVTDFKCTNLSESEQDYLRRSFPSKHATLSFYSMVYLSVYLQKKVRWEYLSVFNNCLQVIFVSAAWWISIIQVADSYNRIEDVIAGIVIGSLVAWFNICAVYNFFKSGVRMSPETAPRTLF